MIGERIFTHLDGDEPGTRPAKIRAFQIVLALVVCTEYWTKALVDGVALEPSDIVFLGLITPLTALIVHGRFRRAAFLGLALVQVAYVVAFFPMAGNHRYLEAILAGLFAVLNDESEEEQRVLLQSVRFLVVLVLFYSGLQKLVGGFYFRGQFLTYAMWRESFEAALTPLLSAVEVERFMSGGPYVASSPFFLVVSNLIWITQIGLAVLLVPRATRRFAWPAACVLLVATETVARELMFGAEFLAALLLFARSDLVRRAVIPIAVLLVLLVAMRLGFVPEVIFH